MNEYIKKLILEEIDIALFEARKKSNGMRSVRKGADKNPKVTKMDFLPDEVLDDIADEIDEAASDNPQYAAGRSASNQACLDAAVNSYNKAKETDGMADDKAAIKKREKCAEGVTLSEGQLKIVINDLIEEIKLDAVLNEIEDRLEEKKKKKKKSGSRKLSKAVKKSLDKKADKRCLTRGSVYAEFRAGLGAYYTSGSRKGMAPHQWAHARVNSANPSKKWAKVKKRKKCPKKKKK